MATLEEAAAATVAVVLSKRSKLKRSIWVKPWITHDQRSKNSAQHTLLQELRLVDLSAYKNYLRVSDEEYNELLQLVTPLIIKKDTMMRKSISPTEMLATTLRFLATGKLPKI